MQQAFHRSGLVPRVVESAYYEGDKAVIAIRACGSVDVQINEDRLLQTEELLGSELFRSV
jgi:hypothetical protein